MSQRWRLTFRRDLLDRGHHLPMSIQPSAEQIIRDEGRDTGQNSCGGLGQRQCLYKTVVHGNSLPYHLVGLLHLVQEKDHGTVQPSGQHQTPVSDARLMSSALQWKLADTLIP